MTTTIPAPTPAELRADLAKHYCWETYTAVDGNEYESVYHTLSNAAIRLAEHYRKRLAAIAEILTDMEDVIDSELSASKANQLRELLRGKEKPCKSTSPN